MDIDLTFEDSISQINNKSDRKLIKELVELRQYKSERDRLISNNKSLVSQLSDMEVKLTEQEVTLNAKDIEIAHLRSRLKKLQSNDPGLILFDVSSPSRRSEVFSDTTEDLQSIKDALERDKKILQFEVDELKNKLKEAESKISATSYERDQLRIVLTEKSMNHRKTYTSKVCLTESSDIHSSVSKEVSSHQFMFSPRISQLNRAERKKVATQRKQKYTPSFMRQKKNTKKHNDETFADSFPEENEHNNLA